MEEEEQLSNPRNHGHHISSSKYLLIGVCILFLNLLCLDAVSFSLSTFQFKEKLANIKVEIDNSTATSNDIFVKNKCDISNVIGVAEFISPIVEIPCVRHVVQEKKQYSGFDLLINYSALQNELDAQIEIEQTFLKISEQKLYNAETEFDTKIQQENIDAAGRSITEFKNQKNNQQSVHEELTNLLRDGQFYNSLYSLIIINKQNDMPKFLTIPDALLSLSMGGLGNLITVTIEYIHHRNQHDKINIAKFIFRPLLVTILALAVYTAFRCRQITISGDAAKQFFPFLLSFIVIVSRMISEHVYNSFVKYGQKFMSDSSETTTF